MGDEGNEGVYIRNNEIRTFYSSILHNQAVQLLVRLTLVHFRP